VLSGALAAELDGHASATATTTNGSSADLFAAYLADAAAVAETLSTIPAGADGRRVKRRLLDALEDEAIARGLHLDPAFFDLRRRVLAGEL